MNAFTASSAVAKLRWDAGAFGDAASATPSQRVAARTDIAQILGIPIGILLTPPATSTAAPAATATACATSATTTTRE